MGWDWHTFHEQPIQFVDVIIEMMRIDAQKAKLENRRAKSESTRH